MSESRNSGGTSDEVKQSHRSTREKRLKTSKGSSVPASGRHMGHDDEAALRNSHGSIVGTFGISRDVTERKLVEEKLMRSEALYWLLFNSINDTILVHEFRSDGSVEPIVEVNDVACRLLEYTREELLGEDPGNHFP
jgi:PAS domain-containing protein